MPFAPWGALPNGHKLRISVKKKGQKKLSLKGNYN